MKFEQLLQIYWVKGFLYGGIIVPFEETSYSLPTVLPGFGRRSFYNLTKKLEYSWFFSTEQDCLKLTEDERNTINVYFSHVASIDHSLDEWLRLTTVRLYLIRSFRGERQAQGQPSRGQRTRSKANTAFKVNTIIRDFITEFKKTHIELLTPVVFHYRKVPRNVQKQPKYKSKSAKKKTNLWF